VLSVRSVHHSEFVRKGSVVVAVIQASDRRAGIRCPGVA
jgi:hypothetical protein